MKKIIKKVTFRPKVVCPKCSSDDIKLRDGSLTCFSCGHAFYDYNEVERLKKESK